MNPIGTPLPVNVAGETLWLLPERALWWPAQRVLWVADLHLGKAATYRALGQPVPSGTTLVNLQRLSQLIAQRERLFLLRGELSLQVGDLRPAMRSQGSRIRPSG